MDQNHIWSVSKKNDVLAQPLCKWLASSAAVNYQNVAFLVTKVKLSMFKTKSTYFKTVHQASALLYAFHISFSVFCGEH